MLEVIHGFLMDLRLEIFIDLRGQCIFRSSVDLLRKIEYEVSGLSSLLILSQFTKKKKKREFIENFNIIGF